MQDIRRAVFVTLVLAAIAALTIARASDEKTVSLANTVSRIENALGNRTGVFVLDTRTGRLFGYRADERFATASAFKILLAGMVLRKVESGALSLDKTVPVKGVEIQSHSPLVGKLDEDADVSIAALCQAAVELSDNTATNLLMAELGGPAGLTKEFRAVGDAVTRIDRWEVELNTNLPGDERDTSSPAAMATTLANLLTGDLLQPAHRDMLIGWLRESRTGHQRLRAGLPAAWQPGDKTGSGQNGAINNVAVVWPDATQPVIIAVLMDGGTADFATHNQAHADIGAAVAAWLGYSESAE